ncbi:MAG: 4-hydroxy-tetrahydrodipicolinate synthase [Clostridia bacterium]|nr:4-hydroxy-tetrahydrodipicolinate synthase [Clostridia bacterium]
MSVFRGSGVALVTPFNEDFSINYEKVRALIEYHIEHQTDSIIICGTTGEASTLDDVEHRALIKFAVEVINGRVPLIAGTGSNDTHHGVLLSQYAESVGADALLCVTPYYNKASQEGLYQHFKAYADHVNIPIILYNVPGRTGMSFSLETIQRLSQIENIVGIKEASGDVAFAAEIVRTTPENFDLYAGNDEITVPILSLGGAGVISVIANILPEETHQLVKLYHNNQTKEALQLQLEMNRLNKALFSDVNPIPIKTAMNLKGFNVGPLRLPLWKMTQTEALEDVLNTYWIGGLND